MNDVNNFFSYFFPCLSWNSYIKCYQYDKLVVSVDNIVFHIFDVEVKEIREGKHRSVYVLFDGTVIKLGDNSYYIRDPNLEVVNYYNQQYILFRKKLFYLSLKEKPNEKYLQRKINNLLSTIVIIRNKLISRK